MIFLPPLLLSIFLNVVLFAALFVAIFIGKIHRQSLRGRTLVETLTCLEKQPELTRELEKMRPFVRSDPPVTLSSAIIQGFFLVAIAPLRFLFILTCLCTYLTLLLILGVIAPPRANGNSFQRLSYLVASKTLQVLSRGVLFGFGILKLEVVNPKNIWDGTSPTIVSNHVSLLDIFILTSQGFMPAWVSKAEVAKIPIMGTLARLHGTVFVEREGSSKTSKVAGEELMNRQKDHRAGDNPIVVFPEGTTSNGKYILAFKSGSFRSGLPVQPCIIEYQGTFTTPSFETIPGIPYVLSMLMQSKASARLTYLPKYVPSPEEQKDSSLYAKNVYSYMHSKSGLKPSEGQLSEKRSYQRLLAGENVFDVIQQSTKKAE